MHDNDEVYMLRRELNEARAEIERLKSKIDSLEIDVSFGKVAIAERNLAKYQLAKLKKQHEEAMDRWNTTT